MRVPKQEAREFTKTPSSLKKEVHVVKKKEERRKEES